MNASGESQEEKGIARAANESDVETSSSKNEAGEIEADSSSATAAASAIKRSHSERWEDQFQKLLQFRDRHGHCNVPYRYPEDPSLGRWAAQQRAIYRSDPEDGASPMSHRPAIQNDPQAQARWRRLQEIYFEWNPVDAKQRPWEWRFAELMQFIEAHGHSRVPFRWVGNPQLANWVAAQRKEYTRFQSGRPSRITQEQIHKLDSVNFCWKVVKRSVSDSILPPSSSGRSAQKRSRTLETDDIDQKPSAVTYWPDDPNSAMAQGQSITSSLPLTSMGSTQALSSFDYRRIPSSTTDQEVAAGGTRHNQIGLDQLLWSLHTHGSSRSYRSAETASTQQGYAHAPSDAASWTSDLAMSTNPQGLTSLSSWTVGYPTTASLNQESDTNVGRSSGTGGASLPVESRQYMRYLPDDLALVQSVMPTSFGLNQGSPGPLTRPLFSMPQHPLPTTQTGTVECWDDVRFAGIRRFPVDPRSSGLSDDVAGEHQEREGGEDLASSNPAAERLCVSGDDDDNGLNDHWQNDLTDL